jgi:hypothetical protein
LPPLGSGLIVGALGEVIAETVLMWLVSAETALLPLSGSEVVMLL